MPTIKEAKEIIVTSLIALPVFWLGAKALTKAKRAIFDDEDDREDEFLEEFDDD